MCAAAVASAMFNAKCFLLFLVNQFFIFVLLNATEKEELVEECKECNAVMDNHCFCFGLGEILGVSCENGSLFSGVLNDMDKKFGTITYEITVDGYPIIPNRILENLIVFRLIIDDVNTFSVSEDAFQGVNRLRWFHVFKSSISVIPNFTNIPHSLRNINIDNSKLTEVKGEFQNLPLVTVLSLRGNEITSVAADAFQGTNIIETLDLSYNMITSLPESLLQNQVNLKKIALSYNQLYTIHGLLNNLTPKFIFLEYNNLNNADDIFRLGMTTVETVALDSNPLGKLNVDTFNKKIPNVRFIYLNNCNLTEFRFEYFKDLNFLALLSLDGNNIQRIENETMNFQLDIGIYLNYNKIESFTSILTFNTKALLMVNNELTSLGTILQNTQMTDIDFSGNKLVTLKKEEFTGVHSTEHITFRSNQLQSIERWCFEFFRNDISNLDLSSNILQSLNGSVKYMSTLKALNISHNLLDHFEDEEFVGLNQLSELYVQHNRIVILRGEMKLIPQLQYLIIQQNNIRSLNPKEIPITLQYLYLKGNPLSCDCRQASFLKWLVSPSAPETDIPVCPISNISSARYETIYECPSSCTCRCILDEDDDETYINLDCHSSQLSSVPPLLEESVISMMSSTHEIIIHTIYENFSITDRTLSIDLGNNSIESVNEVNFPSGLKKLYLASNLLINPPYSVMYLSRLRNLSLGDNPFSCDCNDGRILSFRNWVMSKKDNILDVNNTLCHSSHESSELNNNILITLNDIELCPNDNGLYFTLAFSLLSILLVCATLKITYSRFEMNIKVWLYSHGISWVKEKDLDRGKRFDAFLSFSHQDDAFVTNDIIAVIEKRFPSLRLCIHYRNFIAGEFIHENIMNAVFNSKRTVMVLSRNFLESEWCLLEFRAAHLQALKDKVHRVIVIKVGDLPEELLDSDIKVYLETTTYITWGEKHFWDKLFYVLPSPGVYSSATTIL